MIESNYRRALVLSKGSMIGYFFSRPIAVLLFGLVIVSMFAPVVMKKLQSKMKADFDELVSDEDRDME